MSNTPWEVRRGNVGDRHPLFIVREGINGDGVRLWDDESTLLAAAAPDLMEALGEFMVMWGSRDARSQSKKAQDRRAKMWDKANAAIRKAEKSNV